MRLPVAPFRRRSLDPLGEDVVRHKGGGQTTVTTVVPPKSEEELSLIRKQNELLTIQLDEVKRQSEALREVFPQQKELLQAQVDVALQQTELFKKTIGLFEAEAAPTETQKEIQRLTQENALRTLRGEAPLLSSQQEAQIETYYGTAKAQGQRDIRQFAEEMAASRGMKLTDTPIGAEVLGREKEFVQALEGAKAGAKLNIGQSQQAFTQGVAAFQENLRQVAYQNRLALLGRGTGGSALLTTPTAGVSQQLSALLNALQAERMRQPTQTTTGQGAGGFNVGGAATGALSGAATGAMVGSVVPGIGTAVGAIGGALVGGVGGGFSSARYKRNIQPLDLDEYAKALKRVRETPITRYRYRWEEDRGPEHIGPILELAPPEITDDGKTVNILDYAGLLHAGLKAVDRRVDDFGRMVVAAVKERRHATA